jgi:hypothetical protein
MSKILEITYNYLIKNVFENMNAVKSDSKWQISHQKVDSSKENL